MLRHLVLLDIVMPLMNGLEVAQAVRNSNLETQTHPCCHDRLDLHPATYAFARRPDLTTISSSQSRWSRWITWAD